MKYAQSRLVLRSVTFTWRCPVSGSQARKSCTSLLAQTRNQPARADPVVQGGSLVCPAATVWHFHLDIPVESGDHTDACRLPTHLPCARQRRRCLLEECASIVSTRACVL